MNALRTLKKVKITKPLVRVVEDFKAVSEGDFSKEIYSILRIS